MESQNAMPANENMKPNAGMNTLSACMNKANETGYTESFEMSDSGLFAPSVERHYKPGQVHIVNFYRFEGESDPSDNSILYVIETDDGTKGVLLDAYGAYASEHIGAFIKEVDEMNKKKARPEPDADAPAA